MPDKKYHEFVDLANVQELVGIVKSQGHEFFVSKASCFWGKKDIVYHEHMTKL